MWEETPGIVSSSRVMMILSTLAVLGVYLGFVAGIWLDAFEEIPMSVHTFSFSILATVYANKAAQRFTE